MTMPPKPESTDVKVATETIMPPQQRVNDVGYLPPSPGNASPTISLKEYFDSLIQEKEKRYEQRFVGQQTAVDKADAANEKRFESVNEFRNTLKDQQITFASKIEMNTAFDYVGKSIAKNQEDINEVRLKTTSFITVTEHGLRIAELQLQITAIRDTMNVTQGKNNVTDPALWEAIKSMQGQVGILNTARNTQVGGSEQTKAIYGWIVGAIGLVIGIITFILKFTAQ